MKIIRFIYSLLLAALISAGCSKNICITSSDTHYYNIGNDLPKDTFALSLIQPYADSLNKTMNKIIGYAETDISKGKPESSMGNFFCDALLQQSEAYFQTKPDVCIMNYGGLRISSISKGNITVGKIFELMPFDNFLVLMKVNGTQLHEVLNHIAKESGWPVSGLKMTIKDAEVQHVFIGNEPLQNDKEYQLLISDYMAEGGDRLDMLKNIAYENSGVFVRDALIGFIIQQSYEEKNIHAVTDGRIQYAE